MKFDYVPRTIDNANQCQLTPIYFLL